MLFFFFFSSRRRHTRSLRDWSSDVCSSDLESMNGTLYVAPSPWFATAGPKGSFEIADVPPGRYKLETWCEKLPGTEREVAVRPGETLSVDVSLAAAKP